jgi:hypothetical protein
MPPDLAEGSKPYQSIAQLTLSLPAGLVPAVTSFYADPPRLVSVLDLLPDARALARTTSAIKEMIGLCVYRFRGWA